MPSAEFAHANHTAQITPLAGPNAGSPFRLKSATKVSWKPGAKAGTVPGAGIRPIAVIPQGAEPSWSVELSSLREMMELRKHFGPGASSVVCNASFTWQHPQLQTETLECVDTICIEGFGGESETGGMPKGGPLGGPARDILHNGESIIDAAEDV